MGPGITSPACVTAGGRSQRNRCSPVADPSDSRRPREVIPCCQTDQHWEDVRDLLGLPAGVLPADLAQAFCHTSYARECGAGPNASNQRQEFLGDAVLDLVLAEHLYLFWPDLPEGSLTKLKAAVVRSETLSRVAQQMGLGDHLLLGRGEDETGGRSKPSLLADCLEALVGAVYLSTGLEGARVFVFRAFAEVLAEIEADKAGFDHKTRLQELLQGHTKQTPTYSTVGTTGPPHERVFMVEVAFNATVIGRGEGPSKQLAQQAAAGAALETLADWLDTPSPERETPEP